ncbi:MAG: TPR end-of-group domain-containing protein [Phycisphaerales bacterium]
MIPRLFIPWLLGLVLALGCAGTLRAQGATEPPDDAVRARQLREQAQAAAGSGDFRAAAAAWRSLIELNPSNPFHRYNLACVLARAGDTAAAEAALEDAFAHGFIDLFHMQRDPDLIAIRNTRTFTLLIKGWGELLEARGLADLESLKRRFTPGTPPTAYTFLSDPVLRLHYASAFRPASFDDARAQVARVTAWARRELFPEPPADDLKARPDAWVSVVLPTPGDFFRLVFSDGVGGYYDRDRRRLVTQDLGPGLRHEFLHVLHWRYAERLGQRHPLWIMEGLACLLEDVEMPGEPSSGEFVLKPSWRTNIARRLAKLGGLMPLERYLALPDDKFMSDRPRAQYAQARALCMFLHEQGLLTKWFGAYVKGYDEDATGRAALEEVFDLPLPRIEQRFRAWAAKLPEVAEQSKPARFGLGVSIKGGAGDGVLVSAVVTGARLSRGVSNPLRFRDVILSIDDQPVRTLDDYARILGELNEKMDQPPPGPAPPPPKVPGFQVMNADPPLRTGPKVKVQVRRGTRELGFEVTLIEIPEGFVDF